jgi:AcrR family transcriptional regulator
MPTRRPRGSIRLEALLDAALAIADRDGFRGVTIRAIAAELRAPPMSLYAHFASKEALHDLMFERVLQRLLTASGKGSWQEELEAESRHARGVLLQHPHWLPLVARVAVPASSFAPYERLLNLMVKRRLSEQDAMLAVSSVMSFTLGLVLVERMMTARHGVVVPLEQLRRVKAMLPQLPHGAYPKIASVAARFDRWSFDNIFELGLRSLILGIELHGRGRGVRRPHRTA